MVLTYDVGSIPFQGVFKRFVKGSQTNSILGLLYPIDPASEGASEDRRYFEDKVVKSFVDKLEAGISIPNYPQFRDMTEMFLDCMDGIVRTADGYRAVKKVTYKEKKLEIPELTVLKERAREIAEKVGGFFSIKLCLTGPYTLASMFIDRQSQLFQQFAEIIAQFIERNVFNGKFCTVSLVSIDEPVFGLIDDPLLDYGFGGREALLKAWETIFGKIKSRRIQSIMHLHNTTNDLFWQIESLAIVESHISDILYSSPKTKEYLENFDKRLKASICTTDFDSLIRTVEMSKGAIDEITLNQRTADIWMQIKNGELDPIRFLESTRLISSRLRRILHQYGERVSYAGPECGLLSFPTYDAAIECLHRVSEAARTIPSSTS